MKSFHATLSSFAVFALAGGATLQGQTNYDSEVSVQLSTYCTGSGFLDKSAA